MTFLKSGISLLNKNNSALCISISSLSIKHLRLSIFISPLNCKYSTSGRKYSMSSVLISRLHKKDSHLSFWNSTLSEIYSTLNVFISRLSFKNPTMNIVISLLNGKHASRLGRYRNGTLKGRKSICHHQEIYLNFP